MSGLPIVADAGFKGVPLGDVCFGTVEAASFVAEGGTTAAVCEAKAFAACSDPKHGPPGARSETVSRVLKSRSIVKKSTIVTTGS